MRHMKKEDEMSNRGFKNFQIWKEKVGLPEDFPKLRTIPGNELPNRIYHREEKMEQIIREILNNQLVYISFRDGYGCTTLYRYISILLSEKSTHFKIIPITIDLDSYWGDKYYNLDLDFLMKHKILLNLVSTHWDNVLFPSEYYDIIGAYDRSWDVATHKSKILKSISAGSVNENKKIEQLCPEFSKPIDEILYDINNKLKLKVVLLYDIPYTADEEHVVAMIGHIKDLYEIYSDLDGKLNEVYFLTEKPMHALDYLWKRPSKKINYEPYNPKEIFQILWNHYRPLEDIDTSINGLLAVSFSPFFIECVWDEKRSLEEIIENAEYEFIRTLDCEWKDVFSVLLEKMHDKNEGDTDDY